MKTLLKYWKRLWCWHEITYALWVEPNVVRQCVWCKKCQGKPARRSIYTMNPPSDELVGVLLQDARKLKPGTYQNIINRKPAWISPELREVVLSGTKGPTNV